MKTLIIGANGKVGKLIGNKLKASEKVEPVAFLRNYEQKSYFEELDIETRIGTIEDGLEVIEKQMMGIDAIIFTAGSGANTGADKTLTVDLDGAVKCMIAAEQLGIKRFIMISALKVDSREIWEQNPKLKPYLVAKYFADLYLTNTSLNYTIIRPGRLLDKPGIGKITIENALEKEGIPREDVAAVVFEALISDNTCRKVIDCNTGGIPISAAISEL